MKEIKESIAEDEELETSQEQIGELVQFPKKKTHQVGAKKRYAQSQASGVTSAIAQGNLEKALAKGTLRGKSDIEIIRKLADGFEEKQEIVIKQQEKVRNDKRKEISQEILDYHLEHIRFSYYDKSDLIDEGKVLIYYHPFDQKELSSFITRFKRDLQRIGIKSDQLVTTEELGPLTKENLSNFKKVVTLIANNLISSIQSQDQKLKEELQLIKEQKTILNIPVIAQGKYIEALGVAFDHKLMVDLAGRYLDPIFNNNYQENFITLAKAIYNITNPEIRKSVNDFFESQKVSYYQKQKYLLDQNSNSRLDKIIKENRYGLQTILEEIEELIHKQSKKAVNLAKEQNYLELRKILGINSDGSQDAASDINIEEENDGYTIIHHLLTKPHNQEAQQLINKILDHYPEINVNNVLANGDSFMHLIFKNLDDINDLDLQKIIKRLVNKGSLSHQKNSEGKTVIEIFTEKYPITSKERLTLQDITTPDLYEMAAGFDPDINQIREKLEDHENHHINCANILGENLLIRAVRDKEVELVEFLIKETDINLDHRDQSQKTIYDYVDEYVYDKTEESEESKEIKKIKQLVDETVKTNKKTPTQTKPQEETSEFNSMSASVESAAIKIDQEDSLSKTISAQKPDSGLKESELTKQQFITPKTVREFEAAKELLEEEYQESNQDSLAKNKLKDWQEQQSNTIEIVARQDFINKTQKILETEDKKDLYALTQIDQEAILSASLKEDFFSEEEQEQITNSNDQDQAIKELLKAKRDNRANFLKQQSRLLLQEFCSDIAAMLPDQAKNKPIFISYAWAQEEVANFVHNYLEKDLHAAGFEVTLDTRDLKPGQDIKEFEDRVKKIDHVVIIADPNYKKRSDYNIGGVGDEALNLQERIKEESHDHKPNSLSIFLRSGTEITSIPDYIIESNKKIKRYNATRVQDDQLAQELHKIHNSNLEEKESKKTNIIKQLAKTQSIYESRYINGLIDLVTTIHQGNIANQEQLTKFNQQLANSKYALYLNLNQLIHKSPTEIDALISQQQNKKPLNTQQSLITEEELLKLITENQQNAEIIKLIKLTSINQEQQINFNYQDQDGNSMLHHIARKGNEAIFLEILKQPNIDPYIKNRFNESPQDIAKKYDQFHLYNLYKTDEIFEAAKNNQAERLRAIINAFKQNPNQRNQKIETPLIIACQNGHTETALALIEKGADINQVATGKNNAGATPLHFACGFGHTETALALIKKGADINQVITGEDDAGRTPLSFACEEGRTETALALIEKGADINQVATGGLYAGRTPLSFACERGHTEIALALIEKGADINQADTGEYDDRLTPLSFACQGGHTEIALALIEKGADINQAATGENNAGQTPLSYACQGGHTETALALIEKGADINQVATEGFMPDELHYLLPARTVTLKSP